MNTSTETHISEALLEAMMTKRVFNENEIADMFDDEKERTNHIDALSNPERITDTSAYLDQIKEANPVIIADKVTGGNFIIFN